MTKKIINPTTPIEMKIIKIVNPLVNSVVGVKSP